MATLMQTIARAQRRTAQKIKTKREFAAKLLDGH
jgi:hypothetical protein